MKRATKIILAVVFVLAVAFLIAKMFWRVEVKITPKVQQKTVQTKKTMARPAPQQPAVIEKTAKMAIILDDWGNSRARVKTALTIGRPLTLSILPHLPYSRQIAQEAKQGGLGVMLHMPMQPKGSKQPLEPHTLLTTMQDEEILAVLDKALSDIPQAEGVNNHQGSAATSDERVMRTVLRHLRDRGLFYVDSHVIASSVGEKIAKETGIAHTSRDVFIDNQPILLLIKNQLRQAIKIAIARGRVVVIGHDKKSTLEAIAQMVGEIENSGVRLVLVKEILEGV